MLLQLNLEMQSYMLLLKKFQKLKGLKISVIGNSFIISRAINTKIKKIFFCIIGQCTSEKVLKPSKTH